jgi:hypothetical protein
LVFDIDNNGQCILHIQLHRDGKKSSLLRALIDTGSFYNLANPGTAGIELVDTGEESKILFIGGKHVENRIYACEIYIPSLKIGGKFTFCAFPHETYETGFDAILGTSFLNNFMFQYNYPEHSKFSIEPVKLGQPPK